MATIQLSRSIYITDSELDELKLQYTTLVKEVSTKALSMRLKNTDVEGAIVGGGTVKVNRLNMAVTKDAGTARGAGAGEKIKNSPAFINIDHNKEIVEEIEASDLNKTSIPQIIEKRRKNHVASMTYELDRAYFTALQDSATTVDTSSYTEVADRLLALIEHLESLKNDFVDTVDRSFMVLTLAPKWYDMLQKDYIFTLPNPAGQDTKMFHGVEVLPAPRQSFDAIVQVKGSIAEPVAVRQYTPEKINLADAVAIELFYDYGVGAVTPDLVFATALDSSISA